MALQVLYVTVQFPVPSETFTAVEVRALRRLGVEISVATLKPRPRDCDRLLRERDLEQIPVDHNSVGASLGGLCSCLLHPLQTAYLLKVILTSCRGRPADIVKSLVLLPRSLQLFGKIRKAPPDIVHLYWGHYPSLLGLLIHRFLPSLPVTQSLSAYDLHSRYGPSLALAREVPVVFTLAHANVGQIESFGVTREAIRVVYHGVDIDALAPGGESVEPPIIVIAERLIPLKRTELSLRAFGLVHETHPDATLTILGDGPERGRLEDLARELGVTSAVTFAGHLSHDEVFAQFRRARVFMTMSASERLPNTVKEAMLAECICIVSKTVGIDELIEDRRTGFLVDQEDVETAAKIVIECLAQWNAHEELRKSAREHIELNFSSDAVARQKRDVWQRLAHRGAAQD